MCVPLTHFFNFFQILYKKDMGRNKKSEDSKRKHLTINIDEFIIKKIDEVIEKTGDKRSILIERLLVDFIKDKEIK